MVNFCRKWLIEMIEGKLISNGVMLRSYEMKTVLFLVRLGNDVELIPKCNKDGVRTPDIRMRGLCWEMKSPKGEGKYLLQNTIHKAARQSENLVLDLRRIKINEARYLARINKEFEQTKKIRRIKVILKRGMVLDLER